MELIGAIIGFVLLAILLFVVLGMLIEMIGGLIMCIELFERLYMFLLARCAPLRMLDRLLGSVFGAIFGVLFAFYRIISIALLMPFRMATQVLGIDRPSNEVSRRHAVKD